MKDETELVARAQAGDEDAFSALYQAHVGSVRAAGKRMLRTEDLDDLCQETFLLAFTRIDSFAGNAEFRTWITRIAINQCLMILRRRRQCSNGEGRLVPLDAKALADEASLSMRDAALESVPTRLDVEKALRGLKPQERTMVEMAYLEDATDAEISSRLGVSQTALHNTLYRAKQKLRNC